MRQGNVIGVDPQMIAEAAMEKDAIVMVRVASAIGAQLAGHPALKDTALRSVFLSPISMIDINSFKEHGADTPDKLQAAIIEFIRTRMRPERYLTGSTGRDANDAFEELCNAPFFTDILVNPEIMGGDQWLADKMPERSEKMLNSFVAILRGEKSELSETWPQDLLVGRSREAQIRINFRPRRFYIPECE